MEVNWTTAPEWARWHTTDRYSRVWWENEPVWTGHCFRDMNVAARRRAEIWEGGSYRIEARPETTPGQEEASAGSVRTNSGNNQG